METLQKQYKFDYVVAGSSTFGRDVIPRVAAQFDCAPVTDIIAIHSSNTFTRPTYAGNAICKVKFFLLICSLNLLNYSMSVKFI